MSKVAIVVLADTETHEGLGRVVNALEAVKDRIGGVCEFCAGAFGVKDEVVAYGVKLAGEYDGHPSFKRRGIRSSRSKLACPTGMPRTLAAAHAIRHRGPGSPVA
jgi:hypothetical protein